MAKPSLNARLGIQSWCFRAFKTTPQVIAGLREAGVSTLEICGVHINVAQAPEKTLAEYTAAGITISSFGVNGFKPDEAAARKVFEFAALAGFPTISADLADDGPRLALVERLCTEFGKKIAIHNHGRKHALGSAAALERLFAKASMNVGLCLDTAWALDAGEDPVAMAGKFGTRLYGVHIKDFVFDRAGRPVDVVAGTGNLNLAALAAKMQEVRFDGYLTIEYEGDEAAPVPALTKCVENVRAVFPA